jgi:putative two-component system response regulator
VNHLENRKLLMLVDDELANIKVGRSVLADKYRVLSVTSAKKMLELLDRHVPALILLDISMPDMDGYEAIRILKGRPETRDIPVIFLTARSDSASEMEGLSLGAVDYISKPFSPPLLNKRLELHLQLKDYNDNLKAMVAAKTQTVLKLQNKILKAVAELVECRDYITGGHIGRTEQTLGVLVAALLDNELYLEQTAGWDIDLLLQSSQLHDVGKIGIRDSILLKPGPLTAEEFEAMKKHTTLGATIIERIEAGDEDSAFLTSAKIFAAYHHEKWDGSGYPCGLRGEAIPLLGRLMAIADVYDALVSERPYKKPLAHAEAVSLIRGGSGTHFDPALIRVFDAVADRFKSLA